MRTLLLAVLVALVPLASGCLGCSAYTGGGDKVYARGQDQLILCDNGGFVATVQATTIEGKVDGGEAIRGDDGSLAFDLQDNADGSLTTPQLGATAWQRVDLDKTGLDHADVLCQDLETRPWWTQM